MIIPQFIVADVAKNGTAILVKDRTGNGALYPNTGYGAPNMTRADFDAHEYIINRYDVDGTTVLQSGALSSFPDYSTNDLVIPVTMYAAVYHLSFLIGALTSTVMTRLTTAQATIPASPVGVTQLDRSFKFVSNGIAGTKYEVIDITGDVVTFSADIPASFATPVYWFASDADFVYDDQLWVKWAELTSCACQCDPVTIEIWCALTKIQALIMTGQGKEAGELLYQVKNKLSVLP